MVANGSTRDKQHRFGTFDVATLDEIQHLRRGGIRRMRVIELFQVFHSR